MRRGALRAAALGFLAGGHGVYVQDPVPLAEYYSRTLKGYKGLSWKDITPESASPMLRVKSLGDEEFKDLVRRGYPFVVDDCAQDAELRDFPCSEYSRRYPREHMKAEYTPGQEHVFLEDPTWHTVQKPTAKAPKHLSRGKPLSGPYVWHVKDETEDRNTKIDLASKFPVPYFLNGSSLNANEARDSFEFWFVLENGGSQAHADAYCETTISLQLRGKKTWRLGAFPNITNAFQPYEFHDGQIYRQDEFWRPEHEEVVGPGQCVVFPMGYIHETYVAEGDGPEDGCSVATTFQFQDPQPVHLWRNFLARWGLSHYAREEPCMKRMEPYVLLGTNDKSAKDEASATRLAQEAFRQLDQGGDGVLSREDLLAHFGKPRFGFRAPWTEARDREVLAEAAREKTRWMAEDALLYHDVDGDGSVSLSEFEDSVLKFLAVKRRGRAIRKAKQASKLLESEREWIRSHLCAPGGGECPLLEQLERDHARKAQRRRGRSGEL